MGKNLIKYLASRKMKALKARVAADDQYLYWRMQELIAIRGDKIDNTAMAEYNEHLEYHNVKGSNDG